MATKITKGKLTMKRRKFARAYVETGDARAAYLAAYDAENMKDTTVRSEAYKTMTLPSVNAEVERIFASHGIEFSDVLSIHKRNMAQQEHLPTSQRAVGDYYELLGMKKNAPTPTVNVAFVINRGVIQEGVEVAARTPAPFRESTLEETHEDE